jgi:DNA-binding MarR family transcriptional regulator
MIQIAQNPKIAPKDIGERIGADKDVMSRIVKKLVGLGWVFERKNPEDRRFTQLGMTGRGQEALYEWAANRYCKPAGTFRIEGIQVWEGREMEQKGK